MSTAQQIIEAGYSRSTANELRAPEILFPHNAANHRLRHSVLPAERRLRHAAPSVFGANASHVIERQLPELPARVVFDFAATKAVSDALGERARIEVASIQLVPTVTVRFRRVLIPCSPLRLGITRVVAFRAEEQVRRIHACANVAMVQHAQPVRDRAIRKRVRDAVREKFLVVRDDEAVPGVHDLAGKDVALAINANLLKESVTKRSVRSRDSISASSGHTGNIL